MERRMEGEEGRERVEGEEGRERVEGEEGRKKRKERRQGNISH